MQTIDLPFRPRVAGTKYTAATITSYSGVVVPFEKNLAALLEQDNSLTGSTTSAAEIIENSRFIVDALNTQLEIARAQHDSIGDNKDTPQEAKKSILSPFTAPPNTHLIKDESSKKPDTPTDPKEPTSTTKPTQPTSPDHPACADTTAKPLFQELHQSAALHPHAPKPKHNTAFSRATAKARKAAHGCILIATLLGGCKKEPAEEA
jgi:hypothetical protein